MTEQCGGSGGGDVTGVNWTDIERRGEKSAPGCCSQFVRGTQRPPELQPASLCIPGLFI